MDSITAIKSKKKNKLFPCFRAAASGGPVGTARCKEDASDEHIFPFITVDDGVRSFDGGDGDSGHRKKKNGGGALSRAVKAVLFGTSLAKKIRKRKAKEKQNSKTENQRHQAPFSISNNRSRIASDLNYHNSSTCSSRTSAPFSSSSFCSSSPSSSEMSDISFRFYPTASNRLFRQINFGKIFSGWFLLLVCLLSLVLWGKIGAIICTSVWILCLYRRRIGLKSSDDKVSAGAMSSGEYYKRRVVMEGFLKRDHSGAQNSILRIG
ncbi:uncharacterized protein LOC120087211 [Benincasa hispida]|uniref:uncharacterized protein LOC120087211 n=1 Tax=Benincasa hispida TaxID=102211 RepID=UPI0018FFE065|nr:uncharacterized protein LOC120087211 [Benincasa hispida]